MSTGDDRPTAVERYRAGRRRTVLWLWQRLRIALRDSPVTVMALVWLSCATVAAHLLPVSSRAFLADTVLLRHGDLLAEPWTPLTSLLLPSNPLDALVSRGPVVTAALLFVLGVAVERRLGSHRFLAVTVIGNVVAAIGTLFFAMLVRRVFPEWSESISAFTFAGPGVAVIAAAACATATLTHLWRRRIRATGTTVVVTMALYHGGAVSVAATSAVVCGLFMGRLMRRHRVETRPLGTIHERRVLLSLIITAGAIGPLVGAWPDFAEGPLSILGGSIALPSAGGSDAMATVCAEDRFSRECAEYLLASDPNPGVLLLTFIPTAILLLCSVGLRRGRRLALMIVVVLEIALGGFFLKTLRSLLDVEEQLGMFIGVELSWVELAEVWIPCLVPIGLALLLLFHHRLFATPGPTGSVRRLFAWVTGACSVGLTVYVVGGLAVADQWTGQVSAFQLAKDAPRRLVPLEYLLPMNDAFPALLPMGPQATFLYSWVGVLTWLPMGGALLRAMSHAPAADPGAGRARELLIRYGGGSLSWMGLWEGNRHWFSADGQSYVPFRVIGGVAVTTGDLVGPASAQERALAEFLSYADAQGWTVCFYSATADLRERTAARGWQSTQVAEEAVLLLPDLAFTGKKFQDVRTALNHVKKQNLTTTWTTWREAPLEVRLQIREISEQWVGEQTLPEMSFTLGGLAEIADTDVRLFLVSDSVGVVHGCASWLPIHRDGRLVGWTLDFMRRRPDGFRHTMEVLIGQAALDLKAEGYEELSLSGAPLAKVTTAEEMPSRPAGFPAAVDSVLEKVGKQLEPVYGFRSLLRFKAKFQPTYRPLYLLYPDPAALPAIGTAIARAYLPDADLGDLWQVSSLIRGSRRAQEQKVSSERVSGPTR
ncbi:phosphatidylglycerol lysyltransferase domain-containing protein [Austwickia chelonae]|uniref:phosphatidylglycerol lysyltransferase domain-containing protein n=1 Tax=Austwickia chelonae TaxID=100225 RepID=UPI000E239F67|nr:phosphatidylglycerol lysyltransferase domain-containing protein [Austwickia chelonae]